MKISRDKGGIHTVKGFKVSTPLFEKITAESENYEGGQSEFCREAMVLYFDEKPQETRNTMSFAEMSDQERTELKNRTMSVTALVDANTAWTLKQYHETSGFTDGFVAGEILTRFANSGEIYEMETREEIPTPSNTQFQESAAAESQNPNIYEISLDEIVNENVLRSLQKDGFDENRYYTPEKEQETKQHFDRVLEMERRKVIENLPKPVNNSDEMAKDFADFQRGTKVLFDALINHKGFTGMFTSYKRNELLAQFPVKFHQLFV